MNHWSCRRAAALAALALWLAGFSSVGHAEIGLSITIAPPRQLQQRQYAEARQLRQSPRSPGGGAAQGQREARPQGGAPHDGRPPASPPPRSHGP